MKSKRKMGTTRLTSPSAKQDFLENGERLTKKLICVIADSDEDVESKEELADFLVFILGILDIENERLKFEKIKRETTTGIRRKLQAS